MKSPFLNAHRDSTKKSAQKNGATSVHLFGSFASGEETADSDIDLLVEMEPRRSLFDIIALKVDISLSSEEVCLSDLSRQRKAFC